MNQHNDNNDPLVRLGQGDYVRDLEPADFDGAPGLDVGACVGLAIIALFYFVIGFLLGAWLW